MRTGAQARVSLPFVRRDAKQGQARGVLFRHAVGRGQCGLASEGIFRAVCDGVSGSFWSSKPSARRVLRSLIS